MKPMSPQAKQMLAQYRRARALSPAERARALSALTERIALGDVSGDLGMEGPPSPAPSPTRVNGVPRWAAKLALGGAVSGALLWGALSRPAPPAREPAAAGTLAPPAVFTPPEIESNMEPPARSEPALAAGTATAPAARARRSPARTRTLERPAAAATRLPASTSAPAAFAQEAPSARQEPPELAPEPQRPAADLADHSTLSDLSTSRVRLPEPLPPRETNLPAPRLDEEVKQLREAYDRLRDGEPLRALSALSEHARRFPDGKLVPMRKVARMLALCALGKLDEARKEAELFLQAHPDSAYAGRVRRICDQPSAGLPKID